MSLGAVTLGELGTEAVKVLLGARIRRLHGHRVSALGRFTHFDDLWRTKFNLIISEEDR